MHGLVDEALVGAWIRLMAAQRTALGKIERALKDAGFPPLSWYGVLWELDRDDNAGLRPHELERRMLLAQYNLSRLLDRIEAAGYIQRVACEGDGRGQIIIITAQGRELRLKMWPVYAGAIQAALGSLLSPEEAQTLDSLLRRIL